MPTVAVVGAGPKGIAIAAKARALQQAGLGAPRVVLIDRGAVAGNWSGRQGYTSGLLPLGTPPEKDVGFPYADSWGPATAAVTAVMAEFTWQRHLIGRGVTGGRPGRVGQAFGSGPGSPPRTRISSRTR
jgi:mycobactin lysine-N-oxygenase